MTWKVEMTARAKKALKSTDLQTKQRIEKFIDQLELSPNPRLTGKALQGDLKGLWRYRVGDYRLICEIKDQQLIVLIIELGHRKDVYH